MVRHLSSLDMICPINVDLYDGSGIKNTYETYYMYNGINEIYYERLSFPGNTLLVKVYRTFDSKGLTSQEQRDTSNNLIWTSTVNYNSSGQRISQDFSADLINGTVQFNKAVYLYN